MESREAAACVPGWPRMRVQSAMRPSFSAPEKGAKGMEAGRCWHGSFLLQGGGGAGRPERRR